jgi:hypothetical protein
VGIVYQRLRLSLMQKLGMPTKTKLAELSRAASTRFGWPEDTLFHTLTQAERAMRDINLDDQEALELVHVLHEYSDRLETRRKSAKENPAWR